MRTTSQAETILYQHIKGSSLESACNGGLYKWKRPDGSDKEDIVINSLPITTFSVQRMTLNVNVWVKDIAYPSSDQESSFSTQDSERIETLSDIGMQLLADAHGSYWDFWVESQNVFEEPNMNQHYINFRIQFQFVPN